MTRSRSFFLLPVLVAALTARTASADCISGNCQDGTGTATYTDGGTYVGNFKDGYRQGEGAYTWANKTKYVGNWDRGNQDGQGTTYGADGNVIFAGAWKKGEQVVVASNQANVANLPDHVPSNKCLSGNCLDGFGTYVYSNGDKYEGAFRGGSREGMGTFTWASGIKYVGQWQAGQQSGQGTQFNSDGSVFFDGNWQAGKQMLAANNAAGAAEVKTNAANRCVSGDCQSGIGKYIYEGVGTYEGSFKDGVRSGQGVFTWNEGHKYTGEWLADKMSGHGVVSYADGRKFDGAFKDGVRAIGIFSWADGSRYTGSFKDDRLGGMGVLQNADGSWYIGAFDNDQRNGQGTAYKPDGSVEFAGNWKNNDKAS